MNQPDWQQAAESHIWMPYTQMKTSPRPLAVERTEGCEIILGDGRRLLDAISSWWTAAHGYNHPHIVQAMKLQLEVMPHVMLGGLHHEPAARLAQRLAALLPGDLNRVFFSDSGSVAVEVALKISAQFWLNQNRSGKSRFVCFADSYHGDTVGAMSVCDPLDSMHAHFKGFLLEQYPQAIPNSSEAWDRFDTFIAEHCDSLAGVIIEPLVQAAGGLRFHSAEQLRRLGDTCQRFDLLLIADEIATGFARTGSMFAVQQADVVPDIICLGKGMSGGAIGIAATVATEQIFEAFYQSDPAAALMHGPTFMGNPLACAAANASLDLFDDQPRIEQAKKLQEIFLNELQSLIEFEIVTEVRCLGAIGVVQCRDELEKHRVMEMAIERGVWLRPLRDVIYLMPPLTLSQDQAVKLCKVVREIVTELSTC